jgi:hypothetical protein
LSSCLRSKNLKINIYKAIILPVVLYGCETWSLTLSKEQENRVLRRIFGPKREEVAGGWRNYIMRSFITCALYKMLSGCSSQGDLDGRDM